VGGVPLRGRSATLAMIAALLAVAPVAEAEKKLKP
jgi:hypothetical protein